MKTLAHIYRYFIFSSFLFSACPTWAASDPSSCLSRVPEYQQIATDIVALRLALTLSQDLFPPQDIYSRVIQDLDAIDHRDPDQRNYQYHWAYDTKGLLISTTSKEVSLNIISGKSAQWNCLAEQLSIDSIRSIAPTTLQVHFTYDLNPKIASKLFLRVSGILAAEVNGMLGDGDLVCASATGTSINYLFSDGDGDCVSGCMHRKFRKFQSTSPGNMRALEIKEAENPDWLLIWRRENNCQ